MSARGDPIFAQYHELHVGRVGQVGEDHVHAGGNFGGGRGGDCTLSRQFVHSGM